jgi:FkbM family methyltransferase
MLNKLALCAKRFSRSLRLAASLGVYWISTFFGGRLRVRWLQWACALDDRNKLALHDLVERRPNALDIEAHTGLQRWACPHVVAEHAAATDADKMRAWLTRWVQSLVAEDLLAIHEGATGSRPDEDPRVDAFYALVAAKTNVERHPQAHLAQRFAVHSCDEAYDRSTSQLAQDRFVLFALGERRGEGFFVEFGAADGRDLSNTYLLEREFGWNGIVAEANPADQAALRRNRRCGVSDHCVWSRSGETVQFQVVDACPALSTIAEYQHSDQHDRSRATTIEVPTITLNDLLEQHAAPRHIDYISIDTEGSELAILEAFDFAAYEVSVFTIEHNFTPAREKIQRLMQQHGYVRVMGAISRWDDWYVRADLAARLGRRARERSPMRIAV